MAASQSTELPASCSRNSWQSVFHTPERRSQTPGAASDSSADHSDARAVSGGPASSPRGGVGNPAPSDITSNGRAKRARPARVSLPRTLEKGERFLMRFPSPEGSFPIVAPACSRVAAAATDDTKAGNASGSSHARQPSPPLPVFARRNYRVPLDDLVAVAYYLRQFRRTSGTRRPWRLPRWS